MSPLFGSEFDTGFYLVHILNSDGLNGMTFIATARPDVLDNRTFLKSNMAKSDFL